MRDNDLHIIPRDHFYNLLKQEGCNNKEFIKLYTIKIKELKFDLDLQKLIDSYNNNIYEQYPSLKSADMVNFFKSILAVSTYLEYCNKPIAGIIRNRYELTLLIPKNIQLTEDEIENLKSTKITLRGWEVLNISDKLVKKFFNNTYYRSLNSHSSIRETFSPERLPPIKILELGTFLLKYKDLSYDVCVKRGKWSWSTSDVSIAFDLKKDINIPDTNILYWENLFRLILIIYWINKNQDQDREEERHERDNIQG